MAAFFKKIFGGSASHLATLRPGGAVFPVAASQTLLEAALANNIAFPHNCTVGTCASCRCRLVEGKVTAITDFGYTLSREELEAGYILACQASVKTPVTVEIDDAGDNLPAAEIFSGRVTGQEYLTHDILAVQVSLDRKMRYVAGQYANLVLPGLPARSYSFAAAPERTGRSELTFYVRKVPGGALTEKLFAGEVRDRAIEVSGPHGNFYLRRGDGPMICLAGGSGLAPLLSLLHEARKHRLRRKCVLLFGARTEKDLYALDQIAEIQSNWQGEFIFEPVLSHEPDDSAWRGRRGFLPARLPEYLVPNMTAGMQAYMCGPPPMIDAALSALVEHGLQLGAIYYDKFTDASHHGN
jgi:p-cymene monooxygenase electron transfer component